MPHVNFEIRYSLPWGMKLKFGQGAVIFEPASAFGLSLFYFDPIFMNPFANEHKLFQELKCEDLYPPPSLPSSSLTPFI